MRKLIILLLALIATTAVRAEGEQAVLKRVAEYVAALGSYDAVFDVVAGEYESAGEYSVAGDAYYIALDKAEVYSDGKIRYEVDNERREVSVDVVDLQSRNILDNPTRCFDFVGDDYVAAIEREADGQVTLRLKARDEELEGEILLTVDAKSGRPLAISYLLYDDRIDIKIRKLESRKAKIKGFEKSDYKGYDIIDFR